MPKRVRHHTDDTGLEKIRLAGGIVPGRGWLDVETGVHVEVEPFGTARPTTGTESSPKRDLGCNKEGAFVEFDAPPEMIPYSCGPRNSGIIPVPANQLMLLQGL